MTIYNKFADTPNQIKLEGQEITVRFKRNGDGTGTVSWNIPPPSAGCANGLGVYDGIVITVDQKPANYISTSPKNGTYYNSDNSVDRSVHSGDVIDSALVVGAFYHDRTTTSLILTDVKDRTPYYISAYAVDNVGRYHREGVHSYALPTGEEEGGTPDVEAEHVIQLDPRGGVSQYDITGLDPSKSHGFAIHINRKQYDITLRGVDVGTYDDLVNSINKFIIRIENPYEALYPPNTDGLYLDYLNKKLKLWDGTEYYDLKFIDTSIDIINDLVGTYWYNPSNGSLSVINSGNVSSVVEFINSSTDPSLVDCGFIWIDYNNIARRYNGTTFCEIEYVESNRNPLLPPILTCDNYWYDSINETLGKWNTTTRSWDVVDFLYSNVDPVNIPDGRYWFDQLTTKLFVRNNGDWVEVDFVAENSILVNSGYPFENPEIGTIWLDTRYSKWFTLEIDGWVEITTSIIVNNIDPSIVSACDIWWNFATSTLFIRNEQNSDWIQLTNFSSTINPALPRVFSGDVVWFNPAKNEYRLVTANSCNVVTIIRSRFSPLQLPDGTLWFNGSKLFMRVSDSWIEIPFIKTDIDLNNLTSGIYWYNPSEDILYVFSATGGWVHVSFSKNDLSPNVGQLWLSTRDELLREWNGTDWVLKLPLVQAEFIEFSNDRERSKIRFFTRDRGCKYGVEVIRTTESLFSSLQNNVIYDMPKRGASGKVGGTLYKQLGVGDDGSPDERRDIHNHIRSRLGAPSVQVELTKEELDICIDNALLVLRKYSSYGYKRGMFFLDLMPNQQTYVMTDKCVGFNKITTINAVYRMRGAFFKGSFAGSDLHTYGALQQLYSVATFDMLSFHLAASYMEELETLFATRILYQFYEMDRELKIYQSVIKPERVLVDAYMDKTEQELFQDRNTAMWLRNWALAEAKLTLSQVRGKYQTLPGPNGSTALNAQELITQGETEKQELMDQLNDMSMQDLNNVGLSSHFIIG